MTVKVVPPKRRYELLWVLKCGTVEFYRFEATCAGRRKIMKRHHVPKKMWVYIAHDENGPHRCYGTRNPAKRERLDLLLDGWVNPRAPRCNASAGVWAFMARRQCMLQHPSVAV